MSGAKVARTSASNCSSSWHSTGIYGQRALMTAYRRFPQLLLQRASSIDVAADRQHRG